MSITPSRQVMRLLIVALTIAAFGASGASAHTLAKSTAIARLNHDITRVYNENGFGVTQRFFYCWRGSRIVIRCNIDFQIIDDTSRESWVCGGGYVRDTIFRSFLSWHLSPYNCD